MKLSHKQKDFAIKPSPGVERKQLPGALPDGHQPVLLGMKDPALLSHRLRVGDGRGEKAVPFNLGRNWS